jgi:hypothetical protein
LHNAPIKPDSPSFIPPTPLIFTRDSVARSIRQSTWTSLGSRNWDLAHNAFVTAALLYSSNGQHSLARAGRLSALRHLKYTHDQGTSLADGIYNALQATVGGALSPCLVLST